MTGSKSLASPSCLRHLMVRSDQTPLLAFHLTRLSRHDTPTHTHTTLSRPTLSFYGVLGLCGAKADHGCLAECEWPALLKGWPCATATISIHIPSNLILRYTRQFQYRKLDLQTTPRPRQIGNNTNQHHGPSPPKTDAAL